jgi:hypothetical protein
MKTKKLTFLLAFTIRDGFEDVSHPTARAMGQIVIRLPRF